jgi:hypothetical protein
VPLVVVAPARERATVRELQIALLALQRLDRWLLVHAQHDGILGRRQVEADDVRGLGGKLRIVALTPGFAGGEVDLVGPQEAPYVLHAHITQRRGDQRRRPAGTALWGRGSSSCARMRLSVT